MKKLIGIAALGLLFSTSGFAAPTEPKAFTTGLNQGYHLAGGPSTDVNTHWFVFDVTDGTIDTYFRFQTVSGGADLIADLFQGDTTGFDYTKAGVDKGFFPSNAAIYNDALTYMGPHDDDESGNTDPNISERLAVGRYSLAVSSVEYVLGQGGMAGTYNFTTNAVSIMSPVPEPETYAMLTAGLGVLGLLIRRKHKKDREPRVLSFSGIPA